MNVCKRLLCLMMALVLTGALCACGNSKKDDKKDSGSTTTTTEAPTTTTTAADNGSYNDGQLAW